MSSRSPRPGPAINSSWPVNAEAAGRAVLNGDATTAPKTGDGPVKALRQLRVARAGAMKARTAAANQLHSLCDTAPETVRAQLRPLTLRQKIAIAERWRPSPGHDLEAISRRALRSVARRWRALDEEAQALKAEIKAILDVLAPRLLARHGVGYDTASQLLIAAGDNPDRIANERSFAALCGSSPGGTHLLGGRFGQQASPQARGHPPDR